jgi:hypothetical protein
VGSHEVRNVRFLTQLYVDPDSENFEIDEVELELEVEADVTLFTDPCYGMDADGNRGHIKTEVTDIELNSLTLHFPDRQACLSIPVGLGDKCPEFLTESEYNSLLDQCSEKAWGR